MSQNEMGCMVAIFDWLSAWIIRTLDGLVSRQKHQIDEMDDEDIIV